MNGMKGTLAIGVAILAVIVVGGLKVLTNSDHIAQLQRVGTERGREAAYRLCERENRQRAYLMHEHPEDQDFLERFLPIVDCTPNLQGEGAVVLKPVSAQRAYVRRFVEGRLSPLPVAPAPR